MIYINNPPAVRSAPRSYVANEIVYAFYRDIDDVGFPSAPNRTSLLSEQSPLEQWYDYITFEQMETTFDEFSREARRYCHSKKLNLIIIVDQLNEYYRFQKSQEDWTKTFLEAFGRGSCRSFICSASDSNEEFLMNLSAPTLHIKQIFGEEGAIWLLHLKGLLDIEIKSDPGEALIIDYKNKPQVSAILEATGKSPYEISYIPRIIQKRASKVKIDIGVENKSFNTEDFDLIDDYFEARILHYRELHLKCYEVEPRYPEALSDFFKVATSVDTGLVLPRYKYHDKNLIYVANDSEDSTAYCSVCPAAHKALEKFSGTSERFIQWNRKSQNGFVYDHILNIIADGLGPFHNAMRGCALKKLLIDGISNKIANKDPQIIQHYSNKVTKEGWVLKVTTIDYFKTHQPMRKMKNFLKQATESAYVLYVPNSPNYRLIDCVLMNVEPVKSSKEEDSKIFEVTLYLLQSTANIGTHEKGGRNYSKRYKQR